MSLLSNSNVGFTKLFKIKIKISKAYSNKTCFIVCCLGQFWHNGSLHRPNTVDKSCRYKNILMCK